MTEYDYSPEAYERYLSTQRRIANWVDRTEDCRPQFANALAPPPDYMPGFEDSDPRTKRPSRGRLQRQRSHHFRRSRSPSTDSSSGSEDYEFVPRHAGLPPMRSAPGHLGGSFPQHQLPWNQVPQPMVSPQRSMPPSYYGAPSYPEMKQHRRAHSFAPVPPRQPYPAPPMVYASPPVSPGVYGYSAPQNYVLMPPQQGRPIPYVYLPPPC